MYRLHYAPAFSSLAPHMVLRHLGVPFEPVLVDMEGGENRRAPPSAVPGKCMHGRRHVDHCP